MRNFTRVCILPRSVHTEAVRSVYLFGGACCLASRGVNGDDRSSRLRHGLVSGYAPPLGPASEGPHPALDRPADIETEGRPAGQMAGAEGRLTRTLLVPMCGVRSRDKLE